MTRSALVLSLALTLFSSKPAAAQTPEPPSRITSPILESARTETNPVHPLASAKNDLGRVPASTIFHRMVLLLHGSDAQKAGLAQLLKDQQDPSSPHFHQWLTPQQFGQRFGPSQDDLTVITSWLTSRGFTVEKPTNGRRFLLFTGSSAQVESAFATEMHTFKVNGNTSIANAKPASLPTALTTAATGAKLDSFNGPKPQIFQAVKPQALVGGQLLTTPADLSAIYNSNPLKAAGLQGEGQSIALIEQSNIDPRDVADFRKISGLPAARLNVIVNGPDPGLIGDETEAIADVEYAGAFTPNATLDVIVSASTAFNAGIDLSTIYAVDNLVAPITSLSYGTCEALLQTFYPSESLLYQQAWEQGAAEGISHFVSSGDYGGDGCGYTGLNAGYGVNPFASTPFNVSVGGTEFNIPDPFVSFPSPNYTATGYIPETAWNDYNNPLDGRPLASAGGVSIEFSKPFWQTGPGVPADGARDVPDVALVAGDNLAYLLCERDIGADCSLNFAAGEIGTSLASPSWAGIQALVNQKNNLLNGAGNPNPTYYRLAAGSNSPFHDITVGDTKVPDPSGQLIGYTTTPGYDLATGLGSVDINALATHWSPPTGSSTATVVLTTNATHIMHGNSLTGNVTVASGGSTTPTGDVVLFAGTQGARQLTLNQGGSASLTFGPTSGYLLPGGSYNLTAHYAGNPSFAPATSNAVALTIDPEPTTTSISASPQLSLYGDAVSLAAFATGNNSGTGYAVPGTYTFSEGAKTLGTASIASTGESFAGTSVGASAVLTLSLATPLIAGTHTITVTSPPASASFLASASNSVTVHVLKAGSLLSLSADHTTPAANSTVNLSAILYPGESFTLPVTGSVSFFDGSTLLGSTALGAETLYDGYHVSLPVHFASGIHYLTAVYGGDANDNPSSSGAVNVTVSAKSSSTTTIGGPTLAVLGGKVTVTAVVLGDSNGASPTGTVTFTDSEANSGAGAVVGTATLATTSGSTSATLNTTSLSVGYHLIFAAYPGDANFAPSISQSFQVYVGDFTLTSSASSATVTAGQSTSPITLSYKGSSTFYPISSGVTFSCSGLPAGALCNFSLNPATPTTAVGSVTSGSTTLTITTTGPTLTKASLTKPRLFEAHPVELALAGLLMLGLPLAFRRRRLLPMLLGLVLLATLGGISGCGSSSSSATPGGGYNISSPGTAAGSYAITVTATLSDSSYGALAHSTPINLTVNAAGQ